MEDGNSQTVMFRITYQGIKQTLFLLIYLKLLIKLWAKTIEPVKCCQPVCHSCHQRTGLKFLVRARQKRRHGRIPCHRQCEAGFAHLSSLKDGIFFLYMSIFQSLHSHGEEVVSVLVFHLGCPAKVVLGQRMLDLKTHPALRMEKYPLWDSVDSKTLL